MLSVIIIGIFVIALLFQSVLHRLERKDLYNRIMARDLNDYHRAETKVAAPKESTFTRNPLKKQIMQSEKERKERYMNGESE